jgi:hypothetical protein
VIPCDRFDAELLDGALRGEVQGEELVRHLRECSRCSERWARMRLVAQSIVELPRQTIPSKLEGSIVASLHGGYREDRAIAAMRWLSRVVPPSQLSHAVRAAVGGEERAPAVLDRLLAEEIDDAGRSTARRASARLRRIPAPLELTQRLDELFAGGDPRKTSSPRMRRGLVAFALAASALLVMKLGGAFAPTRESRPIATIEFHGVQSLAELDPLTRELIDQFTGGASFAVPR